MTNQMVVERNGQRTNVDHPSRRPEIERLLDSHQIPWRFVPALRVDEMRLATDSQVRIIRDPEEALVEQYAVALRRGAIFPAVVIRKNGAIVDGNHRITAAVMAPIEHLPGYVVEATDRSVLTVLAAELNQTNGARLTDDEQRALAKLWSVQGMSNKDIAAGLNRTLNVVDRWAREREFIARCQRIGLSAAPHLAMNTQAALASVHNDGAFAALVALAVDAGLSYDALRPAIADVKACSGEAGELAVIKRHRSQLADRIQMNTMGLVKRPADRKKIVESPATAAWKNLKFLTKHSADDLAAVPERNTEVMAEGWRTLATLADQVATRLGK